MMDHRQVVAKVIEADSLIDPGSSIGKARPPVPGARAGLQERDGFRR
jgi:hypothetical protein